MTWSIPPIDFTDVVEEDLAALRTKIVVYIHTGTVLRTPVDTGRARGSWNVSYRGAVFQDSPASAQSAISKGYRQILERAKSPYEVVTISSGLPYIGKLESGTGSKQAPAGMLRITVEGAKARFTR